MPSINTINENIAKFADGKSIRYLNINDKLADKDGKLFDGMTVDRLHLGVKGYQVWADALKPLLTELLGPPAKADNAPPPTGDGTVNILDLLQVVANWGGGPGNPADVNGDGLVNILDLLYVVAHWGLCP